jgi:hypothetical protein
LARAPVGQVHGSLDSGSGRQEGKVITKGRDTSDTLALRSRLKIGRFIASQLEPVNSAREVAKHFGMTEQGLRKAECLALFKVSAKLKELLAQINKE